MSCLEKKDRKQKIFKVSKTKEKRYTKLCLHKKKNETKQKQKTKQKIWRLVHLMN